MPILWRAKPFSENYFSGTSGSFGVPVEKDEKRLPQTTEALDSYALERWEVSVHCFQSTRIHGTP